MKKYWFLMLLICSTQVLASSMDVYPQSGRFVEYNVPDTQAYVLKDTQTGCEYLTKAGGGYTLIEGSCPVRK